MTPKPKGPHGGGHSEGGDGSTGKPHDGTGSGGDGSTSGKPSTVHGGIDASKGMTSAMDATGKAAEAGRPPSPTAGGSSTTTPAAKPPPKGYPPAPTTPPKNTDIAHTPESETHIITGDGGRQGGHLAGTGFSKKTEFPKSWDKAKILDAAHQVTQSGPPSKGPYPTKDANGDPAWAYDYTGVVDGVTVKTTVLANGEIRTAYPPNGADPGVITNPPAPNPAPKGIPMSNPPHYSNPDAGGDGSWTWEGPKGDKVIRVVQDASGNVTTTDITPPKPKK
ncbi:EndoU domain-containing protein [Actinophytocola oryzae]|uniref:EndoU nuclease-like protein n=1 Tax=Actinophytocola oryzae TaxID=502181 RepID=A0A4R7W6B4_9PSEU|nr:EndoU domain-containing protein [Actinophytocola oryzae]TDV57217.1 EndoU nuclease-like protein [Actinophytocola oryzae]